MTTKDTSERSKLNLGREAMSAALLRSQAAEIERLKKANNAFTLLTKSQEERISTLLQSKSKYEEATATLQSERDANATLTAEIERKDTLLRQALDGIEKAAKLDGYTRYSFEPSGIFRHYYASATGDYVDLREFRQHMDAPIAAIKQHLEQT